MVGMVKAPQRVADSQRAVEGLTAYQTIADSQRVAAESKCRPGNRSAELFPIVALQIARVARIVLMAQADRIARSPVLIALDLHPERHWKKMVIVRWQCSMARERFASHNSHSIPEHQEIVVPRNAGNVAWLNCHSLDNSRT